MSEVAVLDLGARDRRAFSGALRRGLEELGFVAIENHGVPETAIEEAYTQMRRFFALPLAEKEKCGGSVGGARGYTAFGVEHAKNHPVSDLKEFFHVGQEWPVGHARAAASPPNRWPEALPEFAPVFVRLFAALEACAGELLHALAGAYELPGEDFARILVEGNSVLRALHYPPLPADAPAGALRAAPHEDINLITLLCAAEGSGLEILTPGGEWLPVETGPGRIVVDAGDMLQQVTGGVIPSTTHRVVNPTEGPGASRYAVPFFAHPPPEWDLSVLPAFATSERCAAHPPITAGDFLDRRLAEIGLTGD